MTTHNSNHPVDDETLFAASTNEMTGLTPTVAHNEREAKNYYDIYPYLAAVPQPPGIQTPDVYPWENIHAEYRTHVSSQSDSPKKE